jgi:hypothetical protein
MAIHPFNTYFPRLPSLDPGSTMEFTLKTGEHIRGMLLAYDDESMVIHPYDSEGNFIGIDGITFKNSQIDFEAK